MDIMSRLPRRAAQAADTVPAYTEVKMEDAPTLFKNSKVSLSRYLDSSTKHKCQNHGTVWKIQSFLLNEICMVILWQDHHEKGNSRKFY